MYENNSTKHEHTLPSNILWFVFIVKLIVIDALNLMSVKCINAYRNEQTFKMRSTKQQ